MVLKKKWMYFTKTAKIIDKHFKIVVILSIIHLQGQAVVTGAVPSSSLSNPNTDVHVNKNYSNDNSNINDRGASPSPPAGKDELLPGGFPSTVSSLETDRLYFDCPNKCACSLNVWKKLEIECQPQSPWSNLEVKSSNVSNFLNIPEEAATASKRLDVTGGIRHFILRNADFGSTTAHAILPPLRENFLTLLELHNVYLDPVAFFKSSLFRLSRDSLQRLEMTSAKIHSSQNAVVMDYIQNGIPIADLSRLKVFDNLTVINSGSPLSQLILQSLPSVIKHINIRRSSLSAISPQHFQYLLNLRSLDLSENHLDTLPSTLTENLRELTFLDVSGNRIKHLQETVFQGLGSLRKLNVSHNSIRYVDTEVFLPLVDIQVIDMSYNDVVQFFEPYFKDNSKLKSLRMRRTWTAETFVDAETGARSRMEMERLINTLEAVEILDLSDNDMLIIPETLAHAPRLSRVNLQGNRWTCSCKDRWFTQWLATTNVTLSSHMITSNLWCHSGSRKYPLEEHIRSLSCSNQNIYNTNPSKYYTHFGRTTALHCHPQRPNGPVITWITPKKRTLNSETVRQSLARARYPGAAGVTGLAFNNNTLSDFGYLPGNMNQRQHVLEDGTLWIVNVTKADFGLYICIAQYPTLNITHYIHVGVDTSVFSDVRIMSFIIGWATSFAFLLLVILLHIVRVILNKCGVEFSCMSKTYQSRRVRTFFEGMEQHKNTQLDWLRDNYNMQAKRIKDNCYSQLERIRESYTIQHTSISDIREYGTNQLHQLRDQYYDQIRRVSGYSAQQLCKVRENYLFQRNRVCKFSSHQLLKLRETYKWQAQTLNKILENLPRTLNLDTCRGIGNCGRTDSIYLEDISEYQSMHGFNMDGKSPLPYHPDMLSIAQMHPDKMEHVSLLIPPEFMTPPDHFHSDGTLGFRRMSLASGITDVKADVENFSSSESSTTGTTATCSTSNMDSNRNPTTPQETPEV